MSPVIDLENVRYIPIFDNIVKFAVENIVGTTTRSNVLGVLIIDCDNRK